MLKQYIAIDLKSFYASVECTANNLDPLHTNLVVADRSRTEKTICLAVSPSLKAYGIPGRARLFEVTQKVREINAIRRQRAPHHQFEGESNDARELQANPSLALSFIAAPPRMALYMQCSTQIYQLYLTYFAPEDIHVYSIDEVFIDATGYLQTYRMTAPELAKKLVQEILQATKITATAGIGTNLYLCKVALDIVSKHIQADQDGVRIAVLDEMSYRKLLWNHTPLTDFWRVGRGYAKKLNSVGLHTMGDIARCSLGKETDYYNEDLLYQLFGINAELLIDHAWGWEPVGLADIKAYKPSVNSISSGQVLSCPYSYDKARLVVWEMADLLVLDLLDKGLVTDQLVLTIGYDIDNLTKPDIKNQYHGEITIDHYGRRVPKHAHGSTNLTSLTCSTRLITDAVMALYDRIVNPLLLVRRINLCANHVVPEEKVQQETSFEQLTLFTDYDAMEQQRKKEAESLERERRIQQALLDIKKKYGKNAVLRGSNYLDGATAKDRNQQIGGHKA